MLTITNCKYLYKQRLKENKIMDPFIFDVSFAKIVTLKEKSKIKFVLSVNFV